MSFEQATIKQPIKIPKIIISLEETSCICPDTEKEIIEQTIRYELVIMYDDDSEVRRYGDLAPQLTSQQITVLKTFLSDMRALVKTEILP